MADFLKCFETVVDIEGGYKLHTVEGDRGGMTYAGIARNAWSDWPGWAKIDAGDMGVDLRNMVAEFYREYFWDKIRGDQILFSGVAFVIYDFAVNAGVKTSVKIAQEIVGAEPDGIMGPKTIAKLSEYVRDESTERLFMAEFSLAKVYRYKDVCLWDKRRKNDKIVSNLKFLPGWINRVQQVEGAA